MGNCQAAEVAAVLVQHPGNGRVDRMYRSVSASEVMSSNPGYYVALVVHQQPSNNEQPVKNQLKLLRPEDTLHIGHVYRLISFEDVIKEFSGKKSAKLGELLKERGVLGVEKNKCKFSGSSGSELHNTQIGRDNHQAAGNGSRGVLRSRHHGGGGQWRPALQSIAES